jgi:hypothetical protein
LPPNPILIAAAVGCAAAAVAVAAAIALLLGDAANGHSSMRHFADFAIRQKTIAYLLLRTWMILAVAAAVIIIDELESLHR